MTGPAERTDTERLAVFWRTVKRMRALQCAYFKSREPETMKQAKDAEAVVDRWVDALGARFDEQMRIRTE